jgi:hypothetical protein
VVDDATMTFKCDICRDAKVVLLPVHPQSFRIVTGVPGDTTEAREFACPQCVPTVPYRRVRAMKVVSAYEAEYFGKYQMPIERTLAARFGEYLLREGLIRFTQRGSKDFGEMEKKIVVTAHLGVVSRDDTVRAGATPEVAATAQPKLKRSLTEREKRKLRISTEREVIAWEPPGEDAPITDEFDEPKSALGARFAGLEIE